MTMTEDARTKRLEEIEKTDFSIEDDQLWLISELRTTLLREAMTEPVARPMEEDKEYIKAAREVFGQAMDDVIHLRHGDLVRNELIPADARCPCGQCILGGQNEIPE